MKVSNLKKGLLALILVITTIIGSLGLGHLTVQAQDDKTYVIATDATFAPFAFVDYDGELAGIDVDVFRAAMEVEGINFEFQPMSFSAAL